MTTKVQTVRIIDTNQNYQSIIHALFIFDSMMNDCGWTKESESKITSYNSCKANITSTDMSIINELIIKADNTKYCDPYISSMIESYRRSKNKIVINFDGLCNGTTKEHHGAFILDKLKRVKIWSEFEQRAQGYESKRMLHYTPQIKAKEDKINLISRNIFNVLPNIETLIIKTTGDTNGHECYPLNVFRLIEEILGASTLQIIEIQQVVLSCYKCYSWIYRLCLFLSSELENKCKANGLSIKYGEIDLWKYAADPHLAIVRLEIKRL